MKIKRGAGTLDYESYNLVDPRDKDLRDNFEDDDGGAEGSEWQESSS